MKILVIHNRYQHPGGEDKVFASETALLRQNGHEVVEYTEDNKRIDGMNPLAVAAGAVWSRTSQYKLLNVLRDFQPDVAHFHNTFLLISPAAYYACGKLGVPVVQTLHNYRLFCLDATFFRGERVCEDCLAKILPWPGVLHGCYHGSRAHSAVVGSMIAVHRALGTWQKKVDIYIALSEFSRKKFTEGGIPTERIVVKPNFIYSDPGMRRGCGDYVIFVGRLAPGKGIKTLLEAWRHVKGIRLKIVGNGPFTETVRKFVETHRLENIEILGQRSPEEIPGLIKGARFLVFSSEWHETFGLVMIEAFACGVPVVASRLGVATEIVEDGQTGIHFEPGNPQDLGAKVEWAWTHTKEMQEMGRKARARYEAKYTAGQNYKMLMEIYQMARERRETSR